MNQFSKQPSEKFPISIDFSTNTLDELESITSYDLVIEDFNNIDVSDSMIIDSSNDDNTVNIVVGNGVNGCKYKLSIIVNTSLNNIYEEDIFINVIDI